jgi:hypothetical protein
MATKPKAGRFKKPTAKKMTPAEQSERFIRTARELGVDETGREFEKAISSMIQPTASRRAK